MIPEHMAKEVAYIYMEKGIEMEEALKFSRKIGEKSLGLQIKNFETHYCVMIRCLREHEQVVRAFLKPELADAVGEELMLAKPDKCKVYVLKNVPRHLDDATLVNHLNERIGWSVKPIGTVRDSEEKGRKGKGKGKGRKGGNTRDVKVHTLEHPEKSAICFSDGSCITFLVYDAMVYGKSSAYAEAAKRIRDK